MHCTVYKSRRKADTYLFLRRRDDADDDSVELPSALAEMLGPLEEVMVLELAPGRHLANADVDEVIARLTEPGYYLQLPPAEGNPLDKPAC